MYALRAREGLPPLLKSASCCRKGPQVLSRHGVSVSLARWSRRQESNFRCAPQGWRSGQSGESTSPSQSATAWVAALAACLTVASDQTERTGLCEQQQKIVWVDAYGKKVREDYPVRCCVQAWLWVRVVLTQNIKYLLYLTRKVVALQSKEKVISSPMR